MNTLEPISFSEFCQALSKERVRHERAREKLEARLKAFQKECKHKSTRFQEDPAGGRDSYFICNVCDKAL